MGRVQKKKPSAKSFGLFLLGILLFAIGLFSIVFQSSQLKSKRNIKLKQKLRTIPKRKRSIISEKNNRYLPKKLWKQCKLGLVDLLDDDEPLPKELENTKKNTRYFAFDTSFPDRFGLIDFMNRTDKKPTCSHNPSLITQFTKCGYPGDSILNGTSTYRLKDVIGEEILFDNCSVIPSECKPKYMNRYFEHYADPIYVISLPKKEQDGKPEYQYIIDQFSMYNMKATYFPAINGRELFQHCHAPNAYWPLSQGEMGIRKTFQAVFLKALRENVERVLVVEDDVMFASDFEKSLEEIMSDPYCYDSVYDEQDGGILMLGGSDYGIRKRWKNETYDPFLSQERKCYNVNMQTYGAFAVVYHRNVFLPILQFLEDPMHAGFPFDHIYSFLALQGFNIKVATRAVITANVLHTSQSGGSRAKKVKTSQFMQVNFLLKRSCALMWRLEDFPLYKNWLITKELPLDFEKYCSNEQEKLHFSHFATILAIHDVDLCSVLEKITIYEEMNFWSELYPFFDGRNGMMLKVMFFITNSSPQKAANLRGYRLGKMDLEVNNNEESIEKVIHHYLPDGKLTCSFNLIEQAFSVMDKYGFEAFLFNGQKISLHGMRSVRAKIDRQRVKYHLYAESMEFFESFDRNSMYNVILETKKAATEGGSGHIWYAVDAGVDSFEILEITKAIPRPKRVSRMFGLPTT